MILRKILKHVIITVLLFSGFIFIYGKKLNVIQIPQKSDVIVCLGGGYIERVQKTAELYNAGFSKNIIITGTGIGLLNSDDENGFWKTPYFEKKGIGKEHIVKLTETPNTYAEITALKAYMLKHQLKSALIVSDPPHLKRIQYITGQLDYANKGLSVRVVGSDVTWWSKSRFCTTPKEFWEAAKELMGVVYYFIRY